MKKKLVILEGPDGVGKSTQAKILAAKFNARLVSQPSDDNIVSWIRAEAKKNPDFTALERQLLIAVSHTVDAFTKFQGVHNIVMDRSFLSGLVYGELMDLKPEYLVLIRRILLSVYQINLANKFDLHFVFLSSKGRLDTADNDVFEALSWNRIAELYRKHYEALTVRHEYFIEPKEKVSLVDITGKDIETVAREIELATVTRLSNREEVDDHIEAWHSSNSSLELFEYLGWTREEYARFVENKI